MHSPRYAFKTLVGPWLVLPAVVLETVNFAQRGMPWRGEALWTVDWFAIVLFILGPLLAGATAVDAARLSRPGNIHLVLATKQPHRPYLRAAAWSASPVLAVHLLTVATGLITSGVHGSVPWPGITSAALIQCAAICWYAALGSAVGRFASPLVAGAVAAVGAFTLIYLLGEGGSTGFNLLALGGATVSRLGYDYTPGYLAAQLALFAITSVLLLWLPLRQRSGLRLPTTAGAVCAALTVVLVAAGPYVLPADRLTPATAAPTDCSGTAPKICLYPEHQRFKNQVVQHMQTLTEAASAAGYTSVVPERLDELSRTYRISDPTVAGMEIPADAYPTGQIRIEDVASALVRPLHCDLMYEEPGPGPAYWQEEFSLYATLLHTAGIKVNPNEFPTPPKILSPQNVQKIMNSHRSCSLESA
ncbi:hypothetical protein ACIQNG_37750 [Streptomyces sp. NPDC091377]|uniref:hypothetical protein n=1 Tax=unclassified Streptomyces TaxID=2593676 RepID=UPI0037FBD6BC